MSEILYGVADLILDLRRITSETEDAGQIVSRAEPLVRRAVANRAWLRQEHYACDAEQGFTIHGLHEEPDHTLTINAIAWLPGRGAPPHDHGTWAVVAGVEGSEHYTHWERKDDGSLPGRAELVKSGESTLAAGEVVTILPGSIHGVANRSGQVTLSFHVYGRNPRFNERSRYDPETGREYPFVTEVR